MIKQLLRNYHTVLVHLWQNSDSIDSIVDVREQQEKVAQALAMLEEKTVRFYHEADPQCAAAKFQRWHFVYLHGQAEKDMVDRQAANNWDRFKTPGFQADLFVTDAPMPTSPGEYEVEIYGKEAIAVLAIARIYGHLRGRVAYKDDAVALAHARDTEKWM